jgi:diguanylate cyclase (GGDEF)-like protein
MTRRISSASRTTWLGGLATLVVATVLALLPRPGYGNPDDPAGPMRFSHVTSEQGLSQANVMAVLQDSIGYMWFGTENGLNRYDGYQMRRYQRSQRQPNSLAHDYVWAVAEDKNGNLWIATDGGGVAHWNRAADSFLNYRHDPADATSIASNHVRTVLVDADGAVWLGTRDQGVDRLDPATGKATHYRHDPSDPASLANNAVYALVIDGAGQLWVGTDGGLNRWHRASGGFIRYQHAAAKPNSLSSDLVRTVYEDRQGTIWVGTETGGLNRLDPTTGRFQRFRHADDSPISLSNDHVRAILEDVDGRLWVGTADGLNLMQRKAGTFTRFVHSDTDPTSLRDNYVMSLFQDRSGLLWVGTRSGGVSKWNPRSWSLGYVDAQWLGKPNISAFADDGRGRVWVGTFGGGLALIDSSRAGVAPVTTQYRHDSARGDSLTDDRVMALLLDRDGLLWIGTMGGGLNRLDPATGRFTALRHDPADASTISSDAIMSLFEDRDGNIWVGTFGGGLNRYDRATAKFTRFAADAADPGKLGSPRVTAIAQDLTGALWVGTDGGGLNLLDPATRTFRQYRHDPDEAKTLGADTVYSLHVDRAGNVWVGTQGGGLDRVVGSASDPQGITFAKLSEAEGLPNNVIYGIHSDQSGNLWLSTNAGLTRLDPGTGAVKAFRRSHGLQGDEFNFGAHYRSGDGKLYFGGADGYNAFHPDRLEEGSVPPPVVLTAFEKMNHPVETGAPYDRLDAATLKHGDDVVTFELAALDFNAPGENRYAYMLEGFDSKWVDLGQDRRITYTNLDAGDYVFRARAASSDGVWSDIEIAVALRVEPAPWATWWAYSAYGLASVLLLAAIWRSQQRKRARHIEYRQQLEREVKARTAELAERNQELRASNEKILEASLTDPLTGLRNRRFVFEQVTKDVELIERQHIDKLNGRPTHDVVDLVFMIVDLDNFKPINDAYGHAAGDEVLVQVRDVLLSACRSSDFVVRWGGDEFLIIARHTSADEAEVLAERIRARMADKIFPLGNGYVVRATCSIGYVCYPLLRTHPGAIPWDDVLNLADTAMYQAKAKRNAWVGFLGGPTELTAAAVRAAMQESPDRLTDGGMLVVRRSGAATTLTPRTTARLVQGGAS